MKDASRHAGRDSADPLVVGSEENAQLMVGHVTDEEKSQKDDADVEFFTPGESTILQQEVQLLNGAKMRYSLAAGYWDILQYMCEYEQELFGGLVNLAKQKPIDLPAATISALRDRHLLQEDGSVIKDLALVIDASFQNDANEDQAALRYPIVHADAAHVEQLRKLANELPRRAVDAIRKSGGKGQDPSR